MQKRHLRAILLTRIDKYSKARKKAYEEQRNNEAAFLNGRLAAMREILSLVEQMPDDPLTDNL